MGLKPGLNTIYSNGVYSAENNTILLEYKLFHTDSSEIDDLVITELFSGKTYGPFRLYGKKNLTDEITEVLQDLVTELKSGNLI